VQANTGAGELAAKHQHDACESRAAQRTLELSASQAFPMGSLERRGGRRVLSYQVGRHREPVEVVQLQGYLMINGG